MAHAGLVQVAGTAKADPAAAAISPAARPLRLTCRLALDLNIFLQPTPFPDTAVYTLAVYTAIHIPQRPMVLL